MAAPRQKAGGSWSYRVDLRIDRADLLNPAHMGTILALPHLHSIQLSPPASGPEVELHFTIEAPDQGTAESFARQLMLDEGISVLAQRSRLLW